MTRPGRLGKAPRIVLVSAVALLGLASCGEDRRQAEPQKGRTVSQSADMPQASVPSAAGTTPMAERVREHYAKIWGVNEAETHARITARVPIGRYVEPYEVAAMVNYLIGDGAGAVTAQALNVCGGLGNY